MKIYVLGSNHFIARMVECKDKLCELGHDGRIHPHYEDFVRNGRQEQIDRAMSGGSAEHAKVKRENDYLRDHYRRILDADAILIVNDEKNGIKNYIGGNVLIEMGQAYVNNKRIYFLNGMPEGLSYMAEIESMDPICLNGQLANVGPIGSGYS
jgi:hypothetical protein